MVARLPKSLNVGSANVKYRRVRITRKMDMAKGVRQVGDSSNQAFKHSASRIKFGSTR